MQNVDVAYRDLVQKVLDYGTAKDDRTRIGTKSLFGQQIDIDARQFPIITAKKVLYDKVVSELLWFLRGECTLEYLHAHDNHIWDDDAYRYYKSRGGSKDKKNFLATSNNIYLGGVYGVQWRYFDFEYDQIDAVWQLLKYEPHSRRMFVTAWNPVSNLLSVLPPCHTGFQFYVEEKNGQQYLSLKWIQRSVDILLGLPFNISSYGTMLYMTAKMFGMKPYRLIGTFGDVHIYNNHLEAAVKTINSMSYNPPTLKMDIPEYNDNTDEFIKTLHPSMFTLEDYNHSGYIKAPLNVGL